MLDLRGTDQGIQNYGIETEVIAGVAGELLTEDLEKPYEQDAVTGERLDLPKSGGLDELHTKCFLDDLYKFFIRGQVDGGGGGTSGLARSLVRGSEEPALAEGIEQLVPAILVGGSDGLQVGIEMRRAWCCGVVDTFLLEFLIEELSVSL